MFIRCLGSGNAFGDGGRFQTCYYLRHAGKGVMLDCGASTSTAMKKQNLSEADVDVILITHLHGDHFGGLPFLLCEIVAMNRRMKPLAIIGPEGLKKRTIDSLDCLYPGIELEGGPTVMFHSYSTGFRFLHDDISITPYRAIHSEGTNPHMLRIEWNGIVVAYTGDTQWTDDIIPLSDGADLFICEASAFRKPAYNHLSVEELSANRERLRAKRIVLTHPGPETLSNLDGIPFELAMDGDILMND